MLAVCSHTHTHKQRSQIYFFFSHLYSLPQEDCLFYYPYIQTLQNSSVISSAILKLGSTNPGPIPSQVPSSGYTSAYCTRGQQQQLEGKSTSHLYAAVKCFPRALTQCSPLLTPSLIKSLLKRDHSHDAAYKTAVGRKTHYCFLKGSIYNVISSALHMFALCARLESQFYF